MTRPDRVRERMEANEKAAIDDIRTVLAAQVAYSDANAGLYEARLECLVAPAQAQCIPSYPTDGPEFLDSALASLTMRAMRGFAGASDDRICFTPDGRPVPAGEAAGTLPPDCDELPSRGQIKLRAG